MQLRPTINLLLKNGKSKNEAEQWGELKEKLRSVYDIERIGYRLNLAEEKRIGKAKVIRSVVTLEETFAKNYQA